MTDAKGNATRYTFAYGEMDSQTKGYGTPAAATWQFFYDPAMAGITAVTDPNGNTSTTSYDGSGNVLTATDALGRRTVNTYNSLNEPLTTTDPLGVTTTMTYDPAGNLQTRSRPLTSNSTVQNSTFHYGDPAHPGDVTSMTDPDLYTWTYGYDANGDRNAVTDPLGDKSTTQYNPVGWVDSTVSARGNATGADPTKFTTTYKPRNNFGQVLVTTDPLGHTTTSGYDANRHLVTFTDANTKTTTYTYDSADEQTAIHRPDGTALGNVYYPDGTLQAQVDGAGQATTYTYDPLARPITVTDPLSRTTLSTYDGAGNTLTVTDAQGQVTTKSYDAANQLKSTSYSDGVTPNVTNINYDADGQRTDVAYGTSGVQRWSWDSLHRRVSSTDGTTTVSYGYDLNGQLTQIVYPGASQVVNRSYDAAGRLTSIKDWLANNTTFGYDADGNPTTTTLPASTAITDTTTYTNSDTIARITATNPSATLASFDYTRDGSNQLTGVVSTGVPADSHSYGYTSLNQLSALDADTGAYRYDPADNPTKLTTQPGQGFDAANQLCWSAAAATGACAAPPAGSTRYGYDQRGNRTSATPPSPGIASSYRYDQANRLVGAQVPGPAPLTPASAGAPTNVTAAAADTSAVVSWSPPAAGPAATSYTVTTNAPAGGTAPAPLAVAASSCSGSPTTCSATISGLSDSLTLAGHGGYSFNVLPVNGAGNVAAATSPTVYPQVTQGEFTPVTPGRILDTRSGVGTCTPSPCTKLANGTLTLKVAGQPDQNSAQLVPPAGANAVVMNVTVVNPTAASWLTVYPSNAAQPYTSNLNWSAGQAPTPNLVTVALGPDGNVKLANYSGSVDVIADVVGYYRDGTITAGSRYNPVVPGRILDTRAGYGTCTPGPCATLGAGTNPQTYAVKVAGQAAQGNPAVPVPAGATAVVMNVTIVNPSAASWLTAYPSNAAQPNTSNLNWAAGQAPTPNLVTVALGPDGNVKLANYSGSVDVIADVVGWYSPAGSLTGARFTAVVPGRIFDTRPGYGTCTPSPCAKLGAGTNPQTYAVKVAGQTTQGSAAVPVPPTGATAVVMNTTIVNPTAASWLTAYPSNAAQPYTSNLNWSPGQAPTPNLVAVGLGPDGNVKLANYAGAVDVIADVVGYYTNDGAPTPPASGTDHTYTYNADGLRLTKTAGSATTTFTWDTAGALPLPVVETTNSSSTSYIYGPDGNPIEQIEGTGTVTWYHHDQLGSTRLLTDSTGKIGLSFTYDPYGTLTATGQPAAGYAGGTTPLGFAGQYTDPESGLIYLRARYYDTAPAQFMSRDPAAAKTRSPYAYVGGNPLNRTDPTGLRDINTVPSSYSGPTTKCITVDAKTGNNDLFNIEKGLGERDGDACRRAFPPSMYSVAIAENAIVPWGSNGMDTHGAIVPADVNGGQNIADPLRRSPTEAENLLICSIGLEILLLGLPIPDFIAIPITVADIGFEVSHFTGLGRS